MRKFAVLMLVGSLAGCSSAYIVEHNMTDNEMLVGKSQSYKDGYADGCRSGVYETRQWMKVSGDEFKRDDARMVKDPDYALAWSDGMRKCTPNSSGSVFVAPKK